MSAENALGYFFFINHVLFFCPTHTHTISSFMGISSRPFVGENGFRLVPQNRVSTENAVGCLILLDQVLLIAPHIHTASAPPWEFPTGFVQKQVKWISQQLRNPLDLLLNKYCWKFPSRMVCVCAGQKESTWLIKKSSLAHSQHSYGSGALIGINFHPQTAEK